MTARALAVLGRGLVDPTTPVLRADDLGVQRGDGVFETARVAAGRPFRLDLHLARLRRGATRLGIASPTDREWCELADLAVADPGVGDAVLKLVLTRGVSPDGPPTAFALVLDIPDLTVRQREHGVHVVTLPLGVDADARESSPWLLGGIKTLSYAVNMASLREAESRGADDVIWLANGGEVLEAPTSTVCWVRDGVVCTSALDTGVLEGTTALVLAPLVAPLAWRGVRATARDLHAAAEVFLASSVRGVAPVLSIDGQPVGDGSPGQVTVALRAAFESLVADAAGSSRSG